MTKRFVLDTNVLLHDVNSLTAFEENEVIIPLLVIEELDNTKTKSDEIGRNARQIARQLDELRKIGSLSEGVLLSNGGKLFILPTSPDAIDKLPAELKVNHKADNTIIAAALELQSKNPDIILVSRDINVRLKCDSLGIKSEDYLHTKITKNSDELYKGFRIHELRDDEINSYFEDKSIEIDEDIKFYPNEFIILKDSIGEEIDTARVSNGQLKPLPFRKEVFGIQPKNAEQKIALELLMDKNINLVSLIGTSGSGKTLISVAAGLQQVIETQDYDQLIVMRPIQVVGNDIGFLPGTVEDKLAPFTEPIHDAINFLISRKNKGKRKNEQGEFKKDPYVEMLFESGKIEVQALAYIRGRSIPNCFIIIDEAQNLNKHELKTIITRASEGTKIVLTGDIAQIDAPHLDMFSNGLTYAIEKFKEYDIAGHVTLLRGERSALSTLAAEIL